MIKDVIYNYVRSFRWKNIRQMNKDVNRFSFWWGISYFFVVLPVVTGLYDESVFAITSYYLWAISYVIGVLGIQLYPIRLKKIHFLCPMNKEKRRMYSYTVFWVRIAIPLLMEIVLGIIFCVAGMINGFVVMIHGVGVMTFFVMMSIKVYGKAEMAEKESDKQFYRGMDMLFLVFYIITEMCTVMFMEQIMNGSILYRYVLIIEMLLFMSITIWCLRSLPDFIEKNCNYINEI